MRLGLASVGDLGRLRFDSARRHEGDCEEGEETTFEEYGPDEKIEAVNYLIETACHDGPSPAS